MSNVHDFQSQESRFNEASEWVARIERGLTGEETKSLEEWLSADARNEALLMEMTLLWDKMDALSRLAGLFHAPIPAPRRGFHFAGGCVVVLIMSIAVFWLVWNPAPDLHPPPTEYVYQTTVGETNNITLSDGTSLVLNTNSRISVRYTDRYRLFNLQKGEVYVKVAKDTTRPLRVMAEGKYIQAVGTEFNVRINSDQKIELLVIEGKVKVGVHNQTSSVISQEADQMEELLLLPSSLVAGQAVILGSEHEEVEEVPLEDIEVKLSWREGNLIFRGESLEEAIREVERYTQVEFIILDENLKTVRVAGLFRAGDVEGLLMTLKEHFNIVYQKNEKNQVLLKSR